MNQFRLGQSLGTVSSASFRRSHNETLIDSLAHQKSTTFAWARTQAGEDEQDVASGSKRLPPYISHQAGVNCLAIDNIEGHYLFSGGADSAIRLWDLEEHVQDQSSGPSTITKYTPKATLTKATLDSHTHALTSLSIYPFDPTPSTLLSTSYDKTLKVHSISPSSITPIHTFQLDFTPHSHSISPLPSSPPLIAVGTAHPAIRLLDLRSGLSTHSLTGPNGAVYTTAWSPKVSHILASGSTDGKVFFFDVRRANAAFASLDLDDAIGVIGTSSTNGFGARKDLLDFNAVAHNGPVTSVQWNALGDKIITSGHDQRIRVWDAASGRNDLVHFGPRIRNERQGESRPLISPGAFHRPGQETLWWPNDDGKGMIFQHHLREGQLLKILRAEGVQIGDVQQKVKRSRAGGSNLGRPTGGGRINGMVWRTNAPTGEGVEMYTAHGDGRICAWLPSFTTEDGHDAEDEGKDKSAHPEINEGASTTVVVVNEAEQKRKRKRDMLEDMLGGLSKQALRLG
ncbi:hypothetical protein A1O7_01579 [Cladophialophora yegresii CBS 114405]|uniref:Uncharacterized protein n=1 Tax=Cladophialophora yegresii CBS 114405 TaxID=1182544 RepID=W9WBA3_9EURO|nr:uncharacterized protein A1O7_01579 [Cladophialophora yegresii CBS 114405]EXJ65238.1 hypothetical protein A1O7_01579 [Cladophialophora yegresii CBS 114405]